jgi:hypothetical protein
MNALPIFYCPKVNTAVAIDGDLKHQPWTSLTPVCDLVLSNGEGTPKQRTRVLSCWDDKNLYVAFDVVDMDIRATFTQREDKVWQEEAVEFFVSPDGNLKKYYVFNLVLAMSFAISRWIILSAGCREVHLMETGSAKD